MTSLIPAGARTPPANTSPPVSQCVLYVHMSAGARPECARTHPVQLLLKPVDGLVPLAAKLGAGVQHALGHRRAREQLHQALDALVGALLVVVLEALDRVEQTLSAVALVLGALPPPSAGQSDAH